MFRRLLLAILVVALPLQGVASTTMIHCGSSHHHLALDAMVVDADMDSSQGTDGQMSGAAAIDGHDHHDHASHPSSSPDQNHHSHHPGGSDSAHHGDNTDCCAVTVALAASLPASFPAVGSPVALPYVAGALP